MEINIQDLETREFGGQGGDEFKPRGIHSLAMRFGSAVDALIINGDQFGEDGGELSSTITLEQDEYLSKIVLRAGSRIDYLRFETNKGNMIEGGGDGGYPDEVEGVILTLGGRSERLLHQLNVLGIFK